MTHLPRSVESVLSRPGLAALIGSCRQIAGIQQRRLAQDLGLSPAGLSHIENNRNPVSERFLSVYSERLFGADGSHRFVQLVGQSKDDDVHDLAAFVLPDDPRRFEQLFAQKLSKLVGVNSYRSAGVRSTSPQTVLRSVPPMKFSSSIESSGPERRLLSAWRDLSSDSDDDDWDDDDEFVPQPRRAASSERDRVIERLRKSMVQHGLAPLLASRNTIPTEDGIRLRIDLVEQKQRLAIDVRVPGQYGFRFQSEMIAKCVLLHDEGYKFVVCYTEPPESELDRALGRSLEKRGGMVTWIVAFEQHLDSLASSNRNR